MEAVTGWPPAQTADLGWTSSVPGQGTHQFGTNLGFTHPNPSLLGFREGVSLSLGMGPGFP